VKSVVSQQVGQANVNGTKLKALAVPLPPKDEQLAIVELLEDTFTRMSKASDWCEAELKRSAALRQSILKDAFSGKLVPQDPSDEPVDKLLERIRTARTTSPNASRKKALA
jgi:type I restriction enzyme S subunit